MKRKNILILGIGNILQSDDGLGVYITNHIIETGIDLPGGVEIIDGGTAGFDLLPIMKGRDKIIIVDALIVEDRAGSIYRFNPEKSDPISSNIISFHQVGILEIIKFLRLMGENPEIEIIGIVPEDIKTFNIGISDAVLKSVPKAIDLIMNSVLN